MSVPLDDDVRSFAECNGGDGCAGHKITEVAAFALCEELSLIWINNRKKSLITDWYDGEP